MDEGNNYLNTGTYDCWKCSKPMKIAWITTSDTFYGPEGFSSLEVLLAEKEGVIIQKVRSKTLDGEEYLANICPHCKAFVGKFFIHDYLYCEQTRILLSSRTK